MRYFCIKFSRNFLKRGLCHLPRLHPLPFRPPIASFWIRHCHVLIRKFITHVDRRWPASRVQCRTRVVKLVIRVKSCSGASKHRLIAVTTLPRGAQPAADCLLPRGTTLSPSHATHKNPLRCSRWPRTPTAIRRHASPAIVPITVSA